MLTPASLLTQLLCLTVTSPASRAILTSDLRPLGYSRVQEFTHSDKAIQF